MNRGLELLLKSKWEVNGEKVKKKFNLPLSMTFEEFCQYVEQDAIRQYNEKGVSRLGVKFDKFAKGFNIVAPMIVKSVNKFWINKSKKLEEASKHANGMKKLTDIYLGKLSELDVATLLKKNEEQQLTVEELKEEVKEEKQEKESEYLLGIFEDEEISPRSTNTVEDEKICREKMTILGELERKYPKIKDNKEYRKIKRQINETMENKNYREAYKLIVEAGKKIIDVIPSLKVKAEDNYFSEEEEKRRLEDQQKILSQKYVETLSLGEASTPPEKNVKGVAGPIIDEESRSFIRELPIKYEKDLEKEAEEWRKLVDPIKQVFDNFPLEERRKLINYLREKYENKGDE